MGLQLYRCFPREVCVRSPEQKASLAALMESFGRAMNRPPAAERAREHLLGFLGGVR